MIDSRTTAIGKRVRQKFIDAGWPESLERFQRPREVRRCCSGVKLFVCSDNSDLAALGIETSGYLFPECPICGESLNTKQKMPTTGEKADEIEIYSMELQAYGWEILGWECSNCRISVFYKNGFLEFFYS